MTDVHPALPRELVLPIAEAIRDHLLEQPVVTRAAVAGSLRRGRAFVHDAELVVELATAPMRTLDGEVKRFVHAGALERLDRALLENELAWTSGAPQKFVLSKAMPPFARPAWGGEGRYRKLRVDLPDGTAFQLDLFVAHPPADFACIYAVRTGSKDFGHATVSRLLRYGLQLKDGRVVRQATGEHLPTASEEEYFAHAHLPLLPPEEREMGHLKTALLFEAP